MRLRVNEVFYSLQGEGVRAGEPSIFIRLSGCNLKCNGTEDGEAYQPICDTEFESGEWMEAEAISERCDQLARGCNWIVWTGGEPALQLTAEVVQYFKDIQYRQAIETNGTRELPPGLDWVCVSPKTAEHTLKVKKATEVKYVRHPGQAIPKPSIEADYYLISPAWQDGQLSPATLAWCIDLCKANPKWRLSVQQHKLWKVR
jgi:organic radical activating enzyme